MPEKAASASVSPDGWTIDTAMAHVLARIDAQDKATTLAFSAQKSAVDAALAAADRAVQKAEAASERRFEAVNEFRATLGDQQRTLMPRSEVEVMKHATDEKYSALKEVVDRLQAERAGVRGGWGFAVGAVGFVLMIWAVVSRMGQ